MMLMQTDFFLGGFGQQLKSMTGSVSTIARNKVSGGLLRNADLTERA